MGDDGKFKLWFHGVITRHEAESLLHNKPVGSFLVRVSETRLGYSMSIRVADRVKHFKIEQVRCFWQRGRRCLMFANSNVSHPNLVPTNTTLSVSLSLGRPPPPPPPSQTSTGHYHLSGNRYRGHSLNDLVDHYSKHPLNETGDILTLPCGQLEGNDNLLELLDGTMARKKNFKAKAAERSRQRHSVSLDGVADVDADTDGGWAASRSGYQNQAQAATAARAGSQHRRYATEIMHLSHMLDEERRSFSAAQVWDDRVEGGGGA